VASLVPSNALVISSIAVFTSLQEPGFAYVVVVSDCRLLRPGACALKLFMSRVPSSLETDSAASFFSSATAISASAASFASEAALAL